MLVAHIRERLDAVGQHVPPVTLRQRIERDATGQDGTERGTDPV
jgi:hypothetical protein